MPERHHEYIYIFRNVKKNSIFRSFSLFYTNRYIFCSKSHFWNVCEWIVETVSNRNNHSCRTIIFIKLKNTIIFFGNKSFHSARINFLFRKMCQKKSYGNIHLTSCPDIFFVRWSIGKKFYGRIFVSFQRF